MHSSIKKYLLPALFTAALLGGSDTYAQFDQKDTTGLDELLSEDAKPQKEYTTAAFKTTRLVNGHSIENTGKGILDFKISHRFSSLSGGVHEFFGLDGATLRLGLDYGVTDWLTVGIGRSTLYKEYDGYVKARILRQTTDDAMPISLSYVGAMSVTSLSATQLLGRPLVSPEKYPFSNRLFFVNQLLIARKFNKTFTLQLMPTHIHYNFVGTTAEPNDVIAIGGGGRVKLSKRVTFNLEYYYQLPDNQLANTTNCLSAGFDIETGGHVFQLLFTNSSGMTERTFIGQTTEKWGDGVRFGFNIARVFTVVKPRGFESSRNKIW